jgi:anthranilate phosphoribosyltransferase
MIKEAISQIILSENLSEEVMIAVMNEIMSGDATPAQIGAFITALRIKGETIDEISGAATVMREKATRISCNLESDILVDTCGTGGDGSGTFNVSTCAAFVVAGAGIAVAKHGNRSISSHCGSADVLEALGVDLSLSAAQISKCIEQVGIGFMFAPALHGAMKYAIGPRREIGIRTIFNMLGPLTNPAGANVQVMGVYQADLVEKIATVLMKLGSRKALVVCGEGNMDEITITGKTDIAETADGKVKTYTITPEDLGVTPASLEDLKGGATPEESASQITQILNGTPGAKLEMTVCNAGAALYAAGAGNAKDLRSGVELAREVISSGKALAKLNGLVDFCKK